MNGNILNYGDCLQKSIRASHSVRTILVFLLLLLLLLLLCCHFQNHRDPLGVILLERVKVVKSGNDFKPYSFVLIFEGDDSRTLFLSAYSEAEMGRWMKAIERARYICHARFGVALQAMLL